MTVSLLPLRLLPLVPCAPIEVKLWTNSLQCFICLLQFYHVLIAYDIGLGFLAESDHEQSLLERDSQDERGQSCCGDKEMFRKVLQRIRHVRLRWLHRRPLHRCNPCFSTYLLTSACISSCVYLPHLSKTLHKTSSASILVTVLWCSFLCF